MDILLAKKDLLVAVEYGFPGDVISCFVAPGIWVNKKNNNPYYKDIAYVLWRDIWVQ